MADGGVKVGEHIYGVIHNGFHLANVQVDGRVAQSFIPQSLDSFQALNPGLSPWQVVHVDTVVFTWTIMALLLVAGFLLSRGLSRVPTGKQTVVEMVVDFSQNTVKSFIAPEVSPYLWYIGALFLFILASNWLGVLPWGVLESGPMGYLHLPMYEAPTGDINTTAGYAILTLFTFYFFGFAHKGLGYFKHFVTPQWWLLPFMIVEDLSRPLSLALRLFANVTAGHVIIAVLLLLVPWFIPLPLMGLEIFVGAIQAFIFAALSAAYIGAAISHDH